MTRAIADFLSGWSAADAYFAVFVLWALTTVFALRRTAALIVRIRDDVARMAGRPGGHFDRARRALRDPGWFDED